MNYGAGNTSGGQTLYKSKNKIYTSDPYLELVTEEEEKNWKGICIAFFVISTIVSMIVTAIVLLSPDDGNSRNKFAKLNLEDIVKGRDLLSNQLFDGKWLSNTELVYKTSDGNIIAYNAFNNNTQILVSNITMKQYEVKKYSVSPDRKYVLFVTAIRPIFHYSFTAEYKIYNVTDQQVYTIEAPDGGKQLQHAEWGTKGNQLIFINGNNIYYQHAVGELIQQITKKGSMTNGIYHGITDWLYGERILRSNKAIYWSPDGSRLCFALFDDSKVDQINYLKYGDYHDYSNLDPKMSTLRFPKPGSLNPIIELWVVELNQKRLSSMASANRVLPPREMMSNEESEYYLNSIVWIDSQRLASIWMNRHQNFSVLSLCSEKHAWICEKHLEVKSDTLGFVDVLDPPLITADKRHYLIRLPMKSEQGTYKQIAMVTINGRVQNFLTQGNSDVIKILAHKQETRTVYYLGTLPSNSMQKHLFSIPDIHSSMQRMPNCLTCNNEELPLEHFTNHPKNLFLNSELSQSDQFIYDSKLSSTYVSDDNSLIIEDESTQKKQDQEKNNNQLVNSEIRNCTFYDAKFSVFSDYYMLQCLGPDVPWSEIRTVDGNFIVMRITPNEKLERLIKRKAYPQVRNLRIPLDYNCYADVKVYLPLSLRENEHFKFPLVIEVLPTDAHSNQFKEQVTSALDFNLQTYLTSNQNIVTARLQLHVMQSSSTERRPRLASSKIFSPNSLTQLLHSAVSILKHRLHFIDENKTAMLGWATGGYLVGQLIGQHPNQFNCSILIAPITNWFLVDSFTGEKFFGIPWVDGNLAAYERSDLSKKASLFKYQNLFISHGTADDEVHLQHSFSLMKALNEEGVLYRSQIYPDGNHNLEDVSIHLFKSIESFLLENFGLHEYNTFFENIKMKTSKSV